MSENLERLQQSAAEAEERATKFERLHAEATIKRELTQAAEEGSAPQLAPTPALLAAGREAGRGRWPAGGPRCQPTNGTGDHVTPKEAIAHLKQINDLGNLFKSARRTARPGRDCRRSTGRA